jgi:glycosyltransferase involved in cell wall biosynthesis
MHIVIPVMSTRPSGGFRMLCQLADEWSRLGHDVTIMAPAFAGPPYYATAARVLLVDGRGEAGPTATAEGLGAGLGGLLRGVRWLRRGLDRYAADADVILANHSVTSWPVALCRSSARKFCYIQAYEAEDYARSGRWPLFPLAAAAYASYHLPLRQIVNSPTYVRYRNLSATDWIPAGIDLRLMQPGPARPPLAGRAIVAGCLGRPEPYKGIADVIAAHVLLRQRGVDARLRIAHGNLPPGTSLPEGAEIVPAKNDAELVAFYQSLDVLVAPATIHLGAPHCPVMEAMACRVAVVSTGAIPASREADNAWIVPPASPGAIADAILDIRDNPARLAARLDKAFSDIQAFSWTVLAPRMIDLFLAGGEPTPVRPQPARGQAG